MFQGNLKLQKEGTTALPRKRQLFPPDHDARVPVHELETASLLQEAFLVREVFQFQPDVDSLRSKGGKIFWIEVDSNDRTSDAPARD